jgi:hypothetical protein
VAQPAADGSAGGGSGILMCFLQCGQVAILPASARSMRSLPWHSGQRNLNWVLPGSTGRGAPGGVASCPGAAGICRRCWHRGQLMKKPAAAESIFSFVLHDGQ